MTDEQLMRQAIAQAQSAGALNEVPVGCAIYHHPTDKIIGLGHNLRISNSDPTAHAEIVALRAAGVYLQDWRLTDCTMAVTLEPCPMCAGAIVNARVARLIFGCADPKAGAVCSLFSLCDDPRLNHRVEIVAGILESECSALLKEFFQAQRGLGKK